MSHAQIKRKTKGGATVVERYDDTLPEAQDPMRRRVVGLLSMLSEHWQNFDRAEASDITTGAVWRLVAAGAVQVRCTLALSMIGSPVTISVPISVTGQFNAAESSLVAKYAPLAHEWFSDGALISTPIVNYYPDAMRLTAAGVEYREAVRGPQTQWWALDMLCGIDDLPGISASGCVSELDAPVVRGRVSPPAPTVLAAAQANASVGNINIDLGRLVELLKVQAPAPERQQSAPKKVTTITDREAAVRDYIKRHGDDLRRILDLRDKGRHREAEALRVERFGQSVMASPMGTGIPAPTLKKLEAWKALQRCWKSGRAPSFLGPVVEVGDLDGEGDQ